MITGNQIRQARKLLGWPSSRLAQRAKVHSAIVRRAESVDGEPPITVYQAALIRDALGRFGIEQANPLKDLCDEGTASRSLPCVALWFRTKGQHELAAKFEMVALQAARGQITDQAAWALVHQIADEEERAEKLQTFTNSLAAIAGSFKRAAPPPPPSPIKHCYTVPTINGGTVNVCQ
jgi:hypothetical protein